MINVKEAQKMSIDYLKSLITDDVLEVVSEYITDTASNGRWFVAIPTEEIPFVNCREERLLQEYLVVNGYKAFFVAGKLEVKWQVC